MKHPASVFTAIAVSFLLVHGVALAAQNDEQPHTGLLVGWGAADVTPEEPVVVQGQFHARVSEGVMDPDRHRAGFRVAEQRGINRPCGDGKL